jgi:hypothetical protein
MRAIRLLRAAYGAALLAVPGRIVRAYGGEPSDGPTMVAARVLGARHLLQAALTGDDPGPVRRVGGAVVDALHAASMFALAKVDAGRRRPALVDGSVAAAFSAAGFAGR